MVKELEIEGASVEEAIEKGLKQSRLKKDEAEIKILDEGKNGLFGLVGAKPAIVRIKSKTADAKNEDTADDMLAEKLAECVGTILKHMKFDGMSVNVYKENDIYKVEINGADKKLLIGKNGQTLNALGLLIPIMAMGKNYDRGIRIDVDVDGYRKARMEKIAAEAKDAAQRVRVSGQPEILMPMSAHDRMIVHTSLKEMTDIETVSEGEGENRRVRINPK